MPETLFPQRQRCKTCRGNLGKTVNDPVLFGLYCSPRCAGIANPATDPANAPRECVTQRDGQWQWKRRYRSEGEIPDRLQADPSTSWYRCDHCGNLHIGRTLVDFGRAQNRGLRSREDLADMLSRARGGATLKQVAAVAGVRPIRIKEWEDPRFDGPSIEVLFKLLPVYRVDLAAVFAVGRTG